MGRVRILLCTGLIYFFIFNRTATGQDRFLICTGLFILTTRPWPDRGFSSARGLSFFNRAAFARERFLLCTGFFFYRITAVISYTRPSKIFPISKTAFWWTSIKCIHDNNGERNFQNHYFIVNSWSIRVALSSLPDSSINRN